MPNYAALQNKKNELIRKALDGSVFIGQSTAPVINALTGADSSLALLPTTGGGYADFGHFTDEGMRFARAVEDSEVTSFGETAPTRSDLTSDDETFAIDFQQTDRNTISLYTGAAFSSLVPDAASGELKIVKPSRSQPRSYRVLCLSVDGPSDAEIYIARFFPRAQITDLADQAYAKGDDAIQWGATFSAKKDTAYGSAMAYLFAGPGWKAQLAAAGFPAA